MPEQKKIIAVVGATGAQGGSLVRAILADKDGEFAVRALTQTHPTRPRPSPRPVPKSSPPISTIRRASSAPSPARTVHSASPTSGSTSRRRRRSPRPTTMARAAKAAGLQHVIWSTLEDTRKWVPLGDDRMPTLGGKYKVPHFDGKGEADAVFAREGVPTTLLLTSFYWDNFIYFGAGPQRTPDGQLALVFPMDEKRLPGIAAEDIGKTAYGIFKRGKELIWKTVAVAGEHLTGEQLAAKMSKALGKDIKYANVPPEVYRGFPFPAPTTWATCSSSSATSTTTSSACATSISPAR